MLPLHQRIMILLIILPSYLIGIFVTYAIMNKISPYDPKNDYDGDGDSNKGFAFFWPLVVFVCLIALPLKGICKLLDLIRDRSKAKRDKEIELSQKWEELTKRQEIQSLQGVLTDITNSYLIKPELGDCLIKIHHRVGNAEKSTIIGHVTDYDFLRETCNSNNLLTKPATLSLGFDKDTELVTLDISV